MVKKKTEPALPSSSNPQHPYLITTFFFYAVMNVNKETEAHMEHNTKQIPHE
jgi:hypothetical protein